MSDMQTLVRPAEADGQPDDVSRAAANAVIRATAVSKDLVGLHEEPSVPEFDHSSLPPRSPELGVAERGDDTEVIVDANPEGTLKAVIDGSSLPAVSQQEVDMDKKLSGPQDKPVEMPAGADDEPVNEATMTAWPGNDASMDAAPESNDNGSQDVNGVESPYNSDAAFSESPTTTSEYDRSSEMLATTTPSTTSPMGYTTSENPTTTTSNTSELPPTTTTPTPSTSSEVSTTPVSTRPPAETMPATTTYSDKD